jgi:hypothetical protein
MKTLYLEVETLIRNLAMLTYASVVTVGFLLTLIPVSNQNLAGHSVAFQFNSLPQEALRAEPRSNTDQLSHRGSGRWVPESMG